MGEKKGEVLKIRSKAKTTSLLFIIERAKFIMYVYVFCERI